MGHYPELTRSPNQQLTGDRDAPLCRHGRGEARAGLGAGGGWGLRAGANAVAGGKMRLGRSVGAPLASYRVYLVFSGCMKQQVWRHSCRRDKY